MNVERVVHLLDLRTRLAELKLDPATTEALGQLTRDIFVLHRKQPLEQLDDRHLRAEATEDRGELATDHAAAEDDQPRRHLGLGEQTRRIDTAHRVDARNGRNERMRAGGHDRALETDLLAALDGDRVRPGEATEALHPFDTVRLE